MQSKQNSSWLKKKERLIEIFEISIGKKNADDLYGIIIICNYWWKMNQNGKKYRKRSIGRKEMCPKYSPSEQLLSCTAITAMVFYSAYSLWPITQEKGNKSGCRLTFKKHWFPVNHPTTDIIWLSSQVSFYTSNSW